MLRMSAADSSCWMQPLRQFKKFERGAPEGKRSKDKHCDEDYHNKGQNWECKKYNVTVKHGLNGSELLSTELNDLSLLACVERRV